MEAARKTSHCQRGRCGRGRCRKASQPQYYDHVEAGEAHLEDKADSKRRFFIRMKGDAQEMLPSLQDSFGDIEIIRADGLEGEFGFTTPS